MNNKNKTPSRITFMTTLKNPFIQIFIVSFFFTTLLPILITFFRKTTQDTTVYSKSSSTAIINLQNEKFTLTDNYLYQPLPPIKDKPTPLFPEMAEINKILNRPVNLMPNLRPPLITFLAQVVFAQHPSSQTRIQKIVHGLELGKKNYINERLSSTPEDGIVALAIVLGQKSHLLPNYSTQIHSLKYFFANLYSIIDNASFSTQLCFDKAIQSANEEGHLDENGHRPYGFSKSRPDEKCLDKELKEYQSVLNLMSQVQYQRSFCTKHKEKIAKNKQYSDKHIENNAHAIQSFHPCSDFVDAKGISYLELFNLLPKIDRENNLSQFAEKTKVKP